MLRYCFVQFFEDESGLFNPRRKGKYLMAGLLAHYDLGDTDSLERFGKAWRTKYAKLDGTLKAKDLPADELINLANKIVERGWLVGLERVELGRDSDEGIKESLLDLVDRTSGNLSFSDSLDLRFRTTITAIRAQVERMGPDQVCWYLTLNRLLGHLCTELRNQGLYPVGRFVLDEKLPIESQELAGFLVRVSIMTRFPEIFARQWVLALGLGPKKPYDVRISTDREEEGLLLADACAYSLGRLYREGNRAPEEFHKFRKIIDPRGITA